MLTIEYRVQFGGKLTGPNTVTDEPETEIVRVVARDLNSGFRKAVNVALEPLGNGQRRQIYCVDFWKVL